MPDFINNAVGGFRGWNGSVRTGEQVRALVAKKSSSLTLMRSAKHDHMLCILPVPTHRGRLGR